MNSTAKWSQKRQPSWAFILPFTVALLHCTPSSTFTVFIFDCVAFTPSHFFNLLGPCSPVPSDVRTTDGNSSTKRLERVACLGFCFPCEGKFDACLSACVIFHLLSAQLADRRSSRWDRWEHLPSRPPETHLPKHCWSSYMCPPCQCWTYAVELLQNCFIFVKMTALFFVICSAGSAPWFALRSVCDGCTDRKWKRIYFHRVYDRWGLTVNTGGRHSVCDPCSTLP